MNIVLEPEKSGTELSEQIVLSHDAGEPASWDSFVDSHPHGSFYHLWAWQRLIAEIFPHRPLHIIARRSGDGQIVGILPLFLVRSRIFGRMLVSTPHGSYGGILANSGPVADAILQRAKHLAKELDVEFLELRNFRNSVNEDGLVNKDLYVTFRKELHADPDLNFNSIPKKTRYEIRNGINNGLEFKVDEIGADEFFDVYSRNVRQLGTPVFPPRLFTVGREYFGPACKLISVHSKGKLVSAAWTIFYKTEFLPHFACSLKEYSHLSVNNFMYWMLMKYGSEHGYTTFDFGKSKQGTGSFAFKTRWGMTMTGIQYQYALVRKQSMPDISPLNPKFAASIEIWRRLPLSLTRVVGPVITKHLI
jgi:FemAB-related protein (PEP-CTERM system-associated)